MPKSSKKSPARQASKQKQPTAKKVAALPGFVQFTKKVLVTLGTHRAVFLRLLALASLVSLLLTGLSSYVYYTGLTQATDEVAGQLPSGMYRTFVEAGALTISVVSGAASATLNEAQQIFLGLFHLLVWLVVVWLLRHLLSGGAVKLRDGLYGAAAPLISTCLVALAGIVQLLPLALIVALMSAIGSTGSASGALWVLLGLVVLVLFVALTVYWLAGTVFAAVIVTLPGTYPWAALRSAKQVIAGYRRGVVLRLLWLGFIMSLTMFIVVLPVVLLDVLTGYRLSGLVILVSQLTSVTLFIYAGAYVYLLYRGVIDERD